MADESTIFARAERLLRDRLFGAVVVGRTALDVTAWTAPGEPVPFAQARDVEYAPAPPGTAWGTPWSTTWFRVRGDVPADWAGDDIELDIDLGWGWGPTAAEGLLRDAATGEPIEGLAAGRPRIPWPASDVDVFVEAAANPAPNFDWIPVDFGAGLMPDAPPRLHVSRCDVVLVDRVAETAMWDLVLALPLVRELKDRAGRLRAVAAIEAACDAIDDLAAPDGRARWQLVSSCLAPVFASGAAPHAPVLHAIGNAHIDTAWLWPFRETIRKVVRTFSNALAVLDAEPEARFVSSQVQHLAWVAEHEPALFERIRARVADGSWLVAGGTWVEPDGNMPSGESFARQFLLGQRWLAEHLGISADTFWLPDTFGYSAGLPQIARLAGCGTFVTQKLSWNSVNRFPHTTLLWEGLDGSRLLTHFPPADTYASSVLPEELARSGRKLAQQPVSDGLFLYGYGDGGGGPSRDMLRRSSALADVTELPRIRHSSVAEFFAAAAQDLPEPPVWSGELYLELHRGTLTSQARIKQLHRRAEALLREAEIWATTATLQQDRPYPAEQLTALWRELLVMEFHDVLPGTSIAWVHDEAVARLEAVVAAAEGIVGAALVALCGAGDTPVRACASPHGADGIPPLAGVVGTVAARPPVELAATADGYVVDNGAIRAVIGAAGITSLVDLGRELVPAGGVVGRIRAHPDRPVRWDAWDLDEHHARGAVEVPAAGPATGTTLPDGSAEVLVHCTWGDSRIEQRFRVAPHRREVEIDTTVDWHARDTLLRLECDLALLSPQLTAETMYGFVDRPTTRNTSWDQARFETCGHRWLRAAEPGYGVAILTPTTYGHTVSRHPVESGGLFTRVGLSLLRSAAFPDPRRDAGTHAFRHVVVPGAELATAVALADRETFAVRELRGRQGFDPVVTVVGGGAAVEAVKLAEDGSGDLVVRVRETAGTRATGTVGIGVPVRNVRRCDLVERELSTHDDDGDEPGDPPDDLIRLELRPFEVVTLRFTPQPRPASSPAD